MGLQVGKSIQAAGASPARLRASYCPLEEMVQ